MPTAQIKVTPTTIARNAAIFFSRASATDSTATASSSSTTAQPNSDRFSSIAQSSGMRASHARYPQAASVTTTAPRPQAVERRIETT